MGRKSNSKQGSRKSPGRELSKVAVQRRKDIGILVTKLLKLTGIFQNTLTPTRSWVYYAEIEALVGQINNLEMGLTRGGKRNRRANLDTFVKWLKENGATFDGIEINEFDGFEFGLKAKKDFPEGTLVLTVPKTIMMSEQDALESDLAPFIEVDPLLQNMPNITLAMYLMLEKNKPDSFWKPYIDVFPEKYATVLYYTPEELQHLKPSPVLEMSLKLYRSIARQYAYFYNKIFTVDLPIMKTFQEIFTFNNYRWAVSTVMTRQNSVQCLGGDFTAFIPLWDMCNHEQGRITTDFNRDLERGECYALRDFKQDEQMFIFYGARPNCDLFLHNGFVVLNNDYDSLTVALGVSSGDPLREKRLRLLDRLGLSAVTHYTLYRPPSPLSAELLAFIRIFNMNEDELDKWSRCGIPGGLVSGSEQIVDEKALKEARNQEMANEMARKSPGNGAIEGMWVEPSEKVVADAGEAIAGAVFAARDVAVQVSDNKVMMSLGEEAGKVVVEGTVKGAGIAARDVAVQASENRGLMFSGEEAREGPELGAVNVAETEKKAAAEASKKTEKAAGDGAGNVVDEGKQEVAKVQSKGKGKGKKTKVVAKDEAGKAPVKKAGNASGLGTVKTVGQMTDAAKLDASQGEGKGAGEGTVSAGVIATEVAGNGADKGTVKGAGVIATEVSVKGPVEASSAIAIEGTEKKSEENVEGALVIANKGAVEAVVKEAGNSTDKGSGPSVAEGARLIEQEVGVEMAGIRAEGPENGVAHIACERMRADPGWCPAVDTRAYKYLETRCQLLKAMYARHAEEPDEPEHVHRRNIRLLKQCEVIILDGAIKYLVEMQENLSKCNGHA